MSHPIDQLFKNKLDSFEVKPSADAWESLQVQRDAQKFRPVKTWLGIAASLLIVMISGYIVYLNTAEITVMPKIQLSDEEGIHDPKDMMPPKVVRQPTVALNTDEKTKQQVERKTKNTPPAPALTIKAAKNISVADNTPVASKNPASGEHMDTPEVISKISVAMVNVPAHTEMPELPANAIAILQEEEEGPDVKTTLFDRITRTARDIKNSDGVMAELREFKDEMISLEFFKTKKSSI